MLRTLSNKSCRVISLACRACSTTSTTTGSQAPPCSSHFPNKSSRLSTIVFSHQPTREIIQATGISTRCFSDTAAKPSEENRSKDPRHDDSFIDIENTKPYVKNPNIKVTERCENIFKEMLKMDVIEAHLLLQLIKERMGMDPNDMRGFGAMGLGGKGRGGTGAGAAEAAPVEEKTIFESKLTAFDEKSKIKIIKEIRAITGLGLKEAKELVEGAPKVVKKDIKKVEAEELKAKLEAVGATVEVV